MEYVLITKIHTSSGPTSKPAQEYAYNKRSAMHAAKTCTSGLFMQLSFEHLNLALRCGGALYRLLEYLGNLSTFVI